MDGQVPMAFKHCSTKATTEWTSSPLLNYTSVIHRLRSYGFRSWDGSFTRKSHDAARPIEFPDGLALPLLSNAGSTPVIGTARESTLCFCKGTIQLHDTFWLKSQPDSLTDRSSKIDTAKPPFVKWPSLSRLALQLSAVTVSETVLSVENVAGPVLLRELVSGLRQRRRWPAET